MSISPARPLRVFLCHSSGDKPIVRELYQRLIGESWIDVWLDEEKLILGQDWEIEIEKALDNSDAVIVTLSTDSVSKEGYVQKELRFVLDIALEKPEGTIFVLPLRLNDCERPRRLRSIHGVDYFPQEQHGRAYSQLRRSLEFRAKSLGIITTIAEPKSEQVSKTPAYKSKAKPRASAAEKITKLRTITSGPDGEYQVLDGMAFSIIPGGYSPKGVFVPYTYSITQHDVNDSHNQRKVQLLIDIKSHCRSLDQKLKSKGDLPNDLILRLPTRAEYTKALELGKLTKPIRFGSVGNGMRPWLEDANGLSDIGNLISVLGGNDPEWIFYLVIAPILH